MTRRNQIPDPYSTPVRTPETSSSSPQTQENDLQSSSAAPAIVTPDTNNTETETPPENQGPTNTQRNRQAILLQHRRELFTRLGIVDPLQSTARRSLFNPHTSISNEPETRNVRRRIDQDDIAARDEDSFFNPPSRTGTSSYHLNLAEDPNARILAARLGITLPSPQTRSGRSI